jgi:endonuclease III
MALPGERERPRPAKSLLPEVVRRLRSAYPYDRLGNKADPLDELVYIVLSTRTRGAVFGRTFDKLKKRYPTWEAVSRARRSSIERLLEPAGLSKKKARWLLEILSEIKKREGRATLARLERMSDREAEQYLIGLPGVGQKTARCVLMYSLRRAVFPVDANSRRLLERLGVLSSALTYYEVHDAAQQIVPKSIREPLHIYAIIHGRSRCLPRKPRCDGCVLEDVCEFARSAPNTA